MTDPADDPAEHNLSRLLQDLREAVDALKSRVEGYRVRNAHFSADLSLYGFLLQAWESGAAVFHLVNKTNLATAANPNARACFETAQDALLLVTERDYDAAGARVRVFERLEHGDLRDESKAAFGDSPREATNDGLDWASASIEADAQRLDSGISGSGDLLRNALAWFKPKFEAARSGKRHPGHWSEKGRRAIAKELEARLSEPGFASRLIATYAHLSRNSHPRLRLENWEEVEREGAPRQYVRRDRAVRTVLGVAELGVNIAMQAAERRP